MAEQDTQSIVSRTTSQLFTPIYNLCSLVKDVSKIVEDKIPLQDEVWAARRKGELTMGQITAVRQMENRMDVDQKQLEAAVGKLNAMDEDMEGLQEKAEAAEYETLLEQKFFVLRDLMASKYQFDSVRPLSTSTNTSKPQTSNSAVPEDPLPQTGPEPSQAPPPPTTVPATQPTHNHQHQHQQQTIPPRNQLSYLAPSSSRLKPIRVPNSNRLGSDRPAPLSSDRPEPPSSDRPVPPNSDQPYSNRSGSDQPSSNRSGTDRSGSNRPASSAQKTKLCLQHDPYSGIPRPGFKSSPITVSNLDISMSSSYRSPTQADMAQYKPVPQSASTAHSVAATPQSIRKAYMCMSAARRDSVSHYKNASAAYGQAPVAPGPPSRPEVDDQIASLLARLEGKRPPRY